MKLNNFQEVADKIIKVIEEECTFDEERIDIFKEILKKI